MENDLKQNRLAFLKILSNMNQKDNKEVFIVTTPMDSEDGREKSKRLRVII